MKELFFIRHFLRWKPAAPRGDEIPKRKTILNVAYPDMVKEHNESMGGWIWMTGSFFYTVWIYKQGRDGTWRLLHISSTFVMSTAGYSIKDTVRYCKCQQRINTICYSLWRVQQMFYCLLERNPSEQPQEDQKKVHRFLHIQVGKNQ